MELTSHGNRVCDVIKHQHNQLQLVQKTFYSLNRTPNHFSLRIRKACQKNKELEGRLKLCQMLPALRRRPLSLAERDLKDLLGMHVL